METRRYLEKPSTLFGLPMTEVGFLLFLWVVLLIIGSFLKMWFPRIPYYNQFTLLVLLVVYGVLRWAARKRRPTFLFSYISFHLLQRKRFFLPENSRIIPNRVHHEKTKH